MYALWFLAGSVDSVLLLISSNTELIVVRGEETFKVDVEEKFNTSA